MLTLFLTYPWEQNQTILFQLQGNLVINLVPRKPKTETKVPQTLGYFLGGKWRARNFYLRARGAQKETVRATFDHYATPARASPKKEDKSSWL